MFLFLIDFKCFVKWEKRINFVIIIYFFVLFFFSVVRVIGIYFLKRYMNRMYFICMCYIGIIDIIFMICWWVLKGMDR